MQRICSSLSRAGYQVHLIGRKLTHSAILKDFPFQQRRIKCLFNKGKLFYLEYNIRLIFFLLTRSKLDAICSIDLDTLLAGTIVAKLRRNKLIYDAHEYFTEVPEIVGRPAVKKIWSWVANVCIPKVDLAYTVCQSLAKEFKQLYKTDFEVIRNLPFEKTNSEIVQKKEGQPFILLYQGMLNDGRGLEEMIQAMQYFDKNEVVFWVIGEGDLSIQLRQLSIELKVEDKVVFHGFKDPSELRSITEQAHIGVNLLQNKGLNYYYSLANKFFDYVQAGKPSINMDFPEYKFHNRQREVSLLLEDLEIQKIVSNIRRLTDEEELYYKLQNNCIIAAKEWVWEKEEVRLKEIYDTLLKKDAVESTTSSNQTN